MTESRRPGPDGSPREVSSLRWPPPGLERLQGDLVRVSIRAALSGGILVLPLLFVLGRDLDFATLGPFADAWWVTLVLAIVGMSFAADALVRAMTLMRRVAKALEQGYDLDTVKLVIVDGDRDMGFLITGSRHFSQMDAREREAIGTLRVLATSLYALAGIWMPNALAACILLGARGLMSPAGLWMTTALPALVLYAFGAVAGTVATARVRRARRSWHGQPWVEDFASGEASAWREDATAHGGSPREASDDSAVGRLLRPGAILVGSLAALIAVPILTLVPTAAVGPILTGIAVPGFDNVGARAGRAEAMRSYRVPVVEDLTPREAAQLLYDLSFAGSDRPLLLGQAEPSRRIPEVWLPDIDETNPTGIHPFDWPDSLFSILEEGAVNGQRTFLEDIAGHPARSDLSRLARASAIDIAAVRYVDPLPREVTLVNLPLPRYGELRAALHSHFAAAAVAFLDGDVSRAEELVSEVVSVGFLLSDGGPTLLDNLTGYAIIEEGANGLADLYLASGQAENAARLGLLREAAEAALSRVRVRYPEGAEAWVRSLPAIVSDTNLARGLRWEIFVGITTLTPCINLHRLVFGPDQEYWDFVDEAYDDLVRWPSEDGLFQLARSGWFGTRVQEGRGIVGRFLSVSMRTGEGTCGDVVRQLEAQEALF